MTAPNLTVIVENSMDRRNCLVCGAPTAERTQLGIDACRACAAFFKRSVLSGRTYTCRQGNGKCAFRKREKFACRSCRYDRCIAIGMEYSEGKSKIIHDETDMRPITSSVVPTTSTEGSILDRMETQYKLSHARRLEQEKVHAVALNLKRIDHPTEELYICTITAYYESFRATIHESAALLRNVFQHFAQLPIPHQKTLFKNFLGRIWTIESVYLTSKYFNNDFNFMGSLLTVADYRHVEDWVSDNDKIERRNEFLTSLKGFAQDYYSLTFPMLKLDQLTVREFYALLAHAYCDVDPSIDLPEELIRSLENTKLKIFSELQEYYRNELKLSDFSKRLCNLMTIAHGAGEAGKLMIEEQRMYSAMFGVYSDDQLYREIYME